MNERLTLQDLTDLLAQQQNLTKKDAENFLRELVSLISGTIEKNDTVKMKDFGTFKLVKVNARKSVDVNTGVDIEIPAHYKLSFTPDKLIKDTLNRPFAHFETVLLEDGVTFDSIEKPVSLQSLDEEEEELDDETDEINNAQPTAPAISQPKLENKAEQILEVAEPTPTPIVEIETAVKEKELPIIAKQEETPVAAPKIEKQVAAEVSKPAEEIPKVVEPVEPAKPIEEKVAAHSTVKHSHHSAPEQEEKRNIARRTTYVDEYEDNDDMIDYGSPRKNYYVIGLIAAAILGVVLLLVKFYPDIQSALFDKDRTFSSAGNTPVDSVAGSQTATNAIDANEPAKTPTEPTAAQAAKNDALGKTDEPTKPTVSAKTEYLAEVTLERGQTLRQLSIEYYKNKVFWVYIFEANRDQVKNPNSINAGMKLKIPALKNYGIDPKNADDLKTAKKKESQLFTEFP